MKLAQFYNQNGEICVGKVTSEGLIPLDFEGDLLDFILSSSEPVFKQTVIALETVRFAPVISRPSKIIALGLNYKDHAEESKGKVPDRPLVFAKFPNTLLAHMGEIIWDPAITKKVDYEAELAIIIGKRMKKCDEKDAVECVYGYTCANDVSARDIQFSDGQWVRGKSLDTFCPLGPWVVTADELDSPDELQIRCLLNGVVMQDSNTKNMIFSIPYILSFLSNNFTLFPGDVILTGTPSGVGAFRDPPVFLKSGDEVIVEIENIGRLINKVA